MQEYGIFIPKDKFKINPMRGMLYAEIEGNVKVKKGDHLLDAKKLLTFSVKKNNVSFSSKGKVEDGYILPVIAYGERYAIVHRDAVSMNVYGGRIEENIIYPLMKENLLHAGLDFKKVIGRSSDFPYAFIPLNDFRLRMLKKSVEKNSDAAYILSQELIL